MSLRARVYLVIIGSAMIAAAAIVLWRDKSLDTELLASIAIFGGVACVIVATIGLPKNGNDK